MIRLHESNTAWLGRPAGIVTDGAWFELDSAVREAALAPYSWVEFKAPMHSAPPALLLFRAGFLLADVQMNFRIRLAELSGSPSLDEYDCRSAADEPFTVEPGEARAFEHERFLALPGVTPAQLDFRYVAWARELITRHPEWSLRLTRRGRTQGWFLSEPCGAGVHLVLAMLSAEATISGQHLYHRSLLEYARRGASLGHAAFSAGNSAVLNIYSQLGARFTAPTGCWLWVRPAFPRPDVPLARERPEGRR